MRPSPLFTVALCFVSLLLVEAQARSFRVVRLPNGAVASCSNCHVNPSGGGARTAFGAAVNTAIGGSSADLPFWTFPMAATDSDGDGISNGAELLDPDGNGVPSGNVGVTNPGNRPPVFTSTPNLTATMGLAYNYVATASDAEGNGINFTKVAGPAWFSISAAGAVSVTPPAGSGGSYTVTIRATDFGTATRGYSLSSNTQTYTLTVISSYPGWQALNFTLPAEAALAAPLADPDGDALANFLEYAVRLPARSASSPAQFAATTDTEGRLAMVLNVRDDDPKLSVVLEAADDPSFTAPVTIAPTITDPIPGDGFREYVFIDTVTPLDAAARFARIRVLLLP